MKRLTCILLCSCLLFISGFVGYRAYKIWKPKHLVNLATQFLGKSDLANAFLCLRQALHHNSNNLEACRMMADLAETTRSADALFWRGRLVELQPESLTNRLALARAAIASGDYDLAQHALDAVRDTDKTSPLYQSAAGSVDIVAGRFSEAEEHFVKAANKEPTNPFTQVRLAALRLMRNDDLNQCESRNLLEGLCTNQLVRNEALRHLIGDALQHTNVTRALALSRELLLETNLTFGDRLRHLDMLRVVNSPERDSFLATLQNESLANPTKAYEVAKWMFRIEPQIALNWIKTLVPATRTNMPVPLVETDCYIAAKNWDTLLTNLTRQSWMQFDCLRLASLARAHWELGATTTAKTEWIAAIRATGNRLDLLTQLLLPARAWNWAPETEDVLWAIVNRYPKEKWAAASLAEQFLSTGRTRPLLTLYATLLQHEPGDLSAMNNFAMAALLTQSWEKRPHELALEAYTKCVTNSSFASTYAFSLLLQDKPQQALKVMEQLSPNQLQQPSIATYYALILDATGNPEKSKTYFDIGAKARLLPEEQNLIMKAKVKQSQL